MYADRLLILPTAPSLLLTSGGAGAASVGEAVAGMVTVLKMTLLGAVTVDTAVDVMTVGALSAADDAGGATAEIERLPGAPGAELS